MPSVHPSANGASRLGWRLRGVAESFTVLIAARSIASCWTSPMAGRSWRLRTLHSVRTDLRCRSAISPRASVESFGASDAIWEWSSSRLRCSAEFNAQKRSGLIARGHLRSAGRALVGSLSIQLLQGVGIGFKLISGSTVRLLGGQAESLSRTRGTGASAGVWEQSNVRRSSHRRYCRRRALWSFGCRTSTSPWRERAHLWSPDAPLARANAEGDVS